MILFVWCYFTNYIFCIQATSQNTTNLFAQPHNPPIEFNRSSPSSDISNSDTSNSRVGVVSKGQIKKVKSKAESKSQSEGNRFISNVHLW